MKIIVTWLDIKNDSSSVLKPENSVHQWGRLSKAWLALTVGWGIKTYRFPWYLTLVSANNASSNPGQTSRQQSNYNHNKITKLTYEALVVPSSKTTWTLWKQKTGALQNSYCTKRFQSVVCGFRGSFYFISQVLRALRLVDLATHSLSAERLTARFNFQEI